jgi:hypothetical protein
MRSFATATFLLILLAPAVSLAQAESPLTSVDLEKLKLRVLDEKQQTQLPPAARKALGMPEARADFKQIVAGDAKTQYAFLVRSDGVADDLCLSIKDEAGTRMYLTNSKQQFRGSARQNVKEPIRMIPSGDPKAAAEFQEILRVWASLAQSL